MNDQLKSALGEIQDLIDANPGLSLDDEYLPAYSGGNSSVLLGHFENRPVLFKRYADPERKQHEDRSLRLFAPSGWVPELYPIKSEHTLVMQRYSGLPIWMVEENVSAEVWSGLFRKMGSAVADVVASRPGADLAKEYSDDSLSDIGWHYAWYRTANVRNFVQTVLGKSRSLLETKDIPEQGFGLGILEEMEQCQNEVLAYPSFLYMDDFHFANMIADGATFQGFVDLEMTPLGNEVLALARVIRSMAHVHLHRWPEFLEGYESRTGTPVDQDILALAARFSTFTLWIRFVWYWEPEEPPQWTLKKDLRSKVFQEFRETVECVAALGLP
jgi:hypothetical protein